ncbi:MAG: TrkA family potassium uptake protein [Clostridiaceae bacterium]|nr:TrkA family potassium uptake protein [Clostridiaceae bacterium]
MYIIIIGCGKVGASFAEVLANEGHDIVIVDNDNNSFKSLSPDFNGITVTGVPIDQDVLKKAGIETADALAAVTPDDNVNIMVCQVAKEIFKVPRVVARIYNPAREHVFHEFGLKTLCPTNITVDVIKAMILGTTDASEYMIGEEEVVFRYEKVQNTSVGRKLTSVKPGNDSFFFGVIKQGKLHFANSEITLGKDDILVFASKRK